MSTTAKERAEVLDRLTKLGVSYDDACTLRRIAMTLHRWFELECGDGNEWASWAIERDGQTGKPYRYIYAHNDKVRRIPIPDKETGARKRLAKIMAHYPQCHAYIQTDPRGASLYLVPQSTLDHYRLPIDQVYNHGVAVY